MLNCGESMRIPPWFEGAQIKNSRCCKTLCAAYDATGLGPCPMTMRRSTPHTLLRTPLLALALALLGSPAHAQTYPSRVIKLIVPFSPGGQPDTIARLIAQHLSASVGTTIIDNRPGANTTIGTKAAAAAEPDGYTLLFGSST